MSDPECTVCQNTSSPHGVPHGVPPGVAGAFGGHEFHYESHNDLFRCIRCHAYEVTVRKGDGPGEFEPCAGQPPAGSGPIEVNAW